MPGDATIIGRIAIKVVPDTEDFRQDAKRELAAIEKALKPIKIDFEVDFAEAKREVDKAVEHAQKSVKDIKVGFNVNERQKRATQAQLALLSRGRTAEIYPKVNKLAAAKAVSTLAALAGARSFGAMATDMAEWAGNLDKSLPKIAGASLAITNLSSAALNSTSNIVSLGASLASTAGAALALPGILGGMALGLGATIAVLKDFNKVLPGVKARFSALQDTMSNNFWDVAKAPIQDFISSIFPQFRREMNLTSTALGGFFANLAKSSKNVFNGELDGMFGDLQDSIQIAGRYTDNFIGILEKLGSVGAGNLPRLATYFGNIARDFDSWLGRKGDNGLQEYVDAGVGALQDLGGVIVETSTLLGGLAKAAEASGGSTLKSLRATMQGASDAVNSPKFQNALRNAFTGARLGMEAISREAGPQFSKFMIRLSNTLTSVLPTAGNALGTALGAVFDALDQPKVQGAAVRAFEALDRAVGNLAPTLPGVANALASVVDVLSKIGENLSRALAPALESLSPAIVGLADDLGPLIDQLGKLLTNAVKGASPVIVELVGVLGDLAGVLTTVLKPINALADAFGSLPSPVKGAITQLATVGALVGATAWMGAGISSRLVGLGGSLLDVGTKAGVAQGAFLRAGLGVEAMGKRMTTARLGLAGLGLALATMGVEAAGSNEKLSTLAYAGGGALLGFSVGGPIGGAIGAGAGALYGLSQAAKDSGKSIAEAVPPAADYTSTLEGLAAAATTATREMAFLELQKQGLISKGNALGISSRELVNSFVNAKGATSGLATSLSQMAQPYKNILASGGELTESQAEQFRTINELASAFGNSRQAYQSQVQDQQELRRATADLTTELKGLPKRLVSKLDIQGLPESGRQLAKLANKYKLVPKDIKTLIEASGVKVSLAAVQRVIAKMKQADRAKANPKVEIETRNAERSAKGVETKVRNLNKVEGISKVKVDDKATEPIGKVRKLLQEYARVTVTATAKLRDLATAGINAVRANLIRLDGDTATVTTNHRSVYTSVDSPGGGGNAGGGSDPIDVDPNGRRAAGAGRLSGLKFAENFAKTVERYLSRTDSIFDKLLDKAKTKGQREAIKDMFDGGLDRLKEMSKRHAKWMRELDQARTKLQGLRSELKAFKDATKQTIIDFANPTSMDIGSYTDLIGQMQNAALEAEEFQRVIKNLIKQGLNSTTLQQILAAGPEAGMATAQAILMGGVDQINAIQQQIQNAANGVAAAAGTELFGGLLNSAQSDVDALIGKLKPLQARLRQFAKDLIKALRDQLNKEFAKARSESENKAPEIKPKSTSKTRVNPEEHSASGKGVTNVLNYNAASGPQLSSEEQLFAAGKRGRLVFVGG